MFYLKKGFDILKNSIIRYLDVSKTPGFSSNFGSNFSVLFSDQVLNQRLFFNIFNQNQSPWRGPTELLISPHSVTYTQNKTPLVF